MCRAVVCCAAVFCALSKTAQALPSPGAGATGPWAGREEVLLLRGSPLGSMLMHVYPYQYQNVLLIIKYSNVTNVVYRAININSSIININSSEDENICSTTSEWLYLRYLWVGVYLIWEGVFSFYVPISRTPCPNLASAMES